ncbi:Vomeronasal type-2 receptor 1, partial [Galemys pyrenaicus]
QEENKPNFRNSTGAFLAAIVGAGGSSLSVAASRTIGLYYYQSNTFQLEVTVELILRFVWVWIGAVATDDDYGKHGIKYFKEKMENHTFVLHFLKSFPKSIPMRKCK